MVEKCGVPIRPLVEGIVVDILLLDRYSSGYILLGAVCCSSSIFSAVICLS